MKFVINVFFIDYATRIRLPDGCRLIINQKKRINITIFGYDVTANFYWCWQVSCQYHDWFWSHDNFCLHSLDQISGNRKYTVWLLSNIWRLRQFRDVKFGTNVSNNMSPHAAKCQGYSFYRFWVIKIKEKLTGAELINNHAVTRETSKHPVK